MVHQPVTGPADPRRPGLSSGHVTGDTDDGATVLDDELRADARDVLTDALQWRLTAARWTAISGLVDKLAAAVRSGDVEAVRTAVADLELLGPVRATPVGAVPVVPAPERVREEINELVPELDDPEPDPAPGR
jgi:hypothetical protein